MMARPGSLVVCLLCIVAFSGIAQTPHTDLNNVSLEIAALRTFHDLGLTAKQLGELAKLAKESTPKGESRQPAKASPELTKAFTNLLAAYNRGDDNQIGDAQEKLDALMDKQEPELDNGITITEGALANATDALKLFNVRQTAAFLATLEVTDPVEFLITATQQVRTVKNEKDQEAEIATVAEELGWLLHGWDNEEASKKTKEQVTGLLRKAARVKLDSAAAGQARAWEAEARKIVGTPENLDILTHLLEHGMAELLSNPRLEAAIRTQTRIASRPPSPPKGKTPDTPKK